MQSPGKEQKGDLYSCMVKEETNPKKAKKKKPFFFFFFVFSS
jgi:hypothetical protein